MNDLYNNKKQYREEALYMISQSFYNELSKDEEGAMVSGYIEGRVSAGFELKKLQEELAEKELIIEQMVDVSIVIKLNEELAEMDKAIAELNTDWCKCASLNAQLNIDNRKLQAELQATMEQLKKAERILKASANMHASGWETYRLANVYFEQKEEAK